MSRRLCCRLTAGFVATLWLAAAASVVLISPRPAYAKEGLAASNLPHTTTETKYTAALRFISVSVRWRGNFRSRVSVLNRAKFLYQISWRG